jgi:hypothetical protein
MYVWALCSECPAEAPKPSAEAAKSSVSPCATPEELREDVFKLLVLVPRLRALRQKHGIGFFNDYKLVISSICTGKILSRLLMQAPVCHKLKGSLDQVPLRRALAQHKRKGPAPSEACPFSEADTNRLKVTKYARTRCCEGGAHADQFFMSKRLCRHGGCAGPHDEAARLPRVCPMALGYRLPPL